MALWTVKGLAQTEAMLHEKSIRVATLERRTGHSVSAELMSLFTGQAFRLLDETMKKEIRRTDGARENLPKMRAVVEGLRREENLSKPRPMDIGSVAESEWGEDSMSHWIWEQDWLAAGGSWDEEAAQEWSPSLDAVGKGGKGKGKGKGKECFVRKARVKARAKAITIKEKVERHRWRHVIAIIAPRRVISHGNALSRSALGRPT